jgi:ABC-type polysaccharide/polyol phosphate export permease
VIEVAPVLGVLAGLCAVANAIPYIRDIVRGTTRPHRGTWLVWAVLATVVYGSQRADGASWSLLMTGAQAMLSGLIFILAVRHGEGGLSAADALLTAMAAAGVVGWVLCDDATVATASVVVADLLAAAMMTPKTYRDPTSETLASFALASVGGALAAGAAAAKEPALLVYPVYFCVVNGALALLIHHRRAVVAAA